MTTAPATHLSLMFGYGEAKSEARGDSSGA